MALYNDIMPEWTQVYGSFLNILLSPLKNRTLQNFTILN